MIQKLSNILAKGGTPMGLSMPSKIFKSNSVLENITGLWTYAPTFLNKAA